VRVRANRNDPGGRSDLNETIYTHPPAMNQPLRLCFCGDLVPPPRSPFTLAESVRWLNAVLSERLLAADASKVDFRRPRDAINADFFVGKNRPSANRPCTTRTSDHRIRVNHLRATESDIPAGNGRTIFPISRESRDHYATFVTAKLVSNASWPRSVIAAESSASRTLLSKREQSAATR